MLNFLLSITDESDHDKILYLYNTYHKEMLRLAKIRLKAAGIYNYECDAEDAIQSAFLKISKYIKSIDFDVDERELRSYVLSIASNEAINVMKDNVYFEALDEHVHEVSDENFINDLMIQERYEQVVKAIEAMDEKYRLVLVYRFGKGYSVKQVAQMLGLPDKTVYTRISRAQKLLKEMMGEDW